MKILYDNFIFELQYAGGISKVWFKLINRLKNIKKIDLFFVEGNQTKNLFRKELKLDSDKIIPDKNKPKVVRRFLSVKNNNSDIYHSSYFRRLKNKGNTKIVVTVHDFIYEKYSSFFSKTAHIFIKKRALKQADAIICVSEHTRQDFFNFFPNINKDKVHVVYNGVDNLYRPISIKSSLKINNLIIEKNEFLLYVGNRGYCKNFPFVIKLMCSKDVLDKNLKLICIGGGRPSVREINLLKDKNIFQKVTFLSDISSTQLNGLYNLAFCLVFPSIYEGFGIPAVEAMKAGCPVWSTNSSSVKELLGEKYPISFNPENWTEALSAFQKLCSDSIRQSAIEIGLKQSLNFNWEKCAEQTLDIYKNLLKDE